LQLAKASGQSFDLVLTRFALERLLFRLSQSPHANRFVLKGAMLMMSWFDDPHRGTRDLDLLGFGDPSPDPMLETFREILAQEAGIRSCYRATPELEPISMRFLIGSLPLQPRTMHLEAHFMLWSRLNFGLAGTCLANAR
jgi:hypothetical protein